jgi:hypothetical protein
MLADPLESLFSGIKSGVLRILFGLFAIFAGFALCASARGPDVTILWVWIGLSFVLLFWWANLGGWFFIGLLFFLLMFAFLWAFVQDRHPRFSFFAIFSAAAAYCSPTTFAGGHWVLALCIYAVVAFCYWVLPLGIALIVSRLAFRTEKEDLPD